MRTVTVLESSINTIDITRPEAEAVNRIGTMLSANRNSDRVLKTNNSVMRCSPTMDGRWSLSVDNIVGVVGLGDTTLLIHPKIPIAHLLHLLSVAGIVPRLSETHSELAASSSFADLIASWFLGEVEELLRIGLLQDYLEYVDDITAARGQILPLASARKYYLGKIVMTCKFDDFGINTPLNRVLKAATGLIMQNTAFPNRLKRRARLVLARFDTVGLLDSNDLRESLDRRTASYSNALQLAKLVLSSSGITLQTGPQTGRTFLFATPDLVERACREILAAAFKDYCDVIKFRIAIDQNRTVSPDLVFKRNKTSVGDVKYKFFDQSWNRDDLYQVVAFATACRSNEAAIVSFVKDAGVLPPSVTFGDVKVTPLAWPASPNITPKDAEKALIASAIAWFKTASMETTSGVA